MKYFKYVILFNQATFNSTTPILNYKGGAFEYLIYHSRTLVCPMMCAGDLEKKKDFRNWNSGKEYN